MLKEIIILKENLLCLSLFVRRSIVAGFLHVNAVNGKNRTNCDVRAFLAMPESLCVLRSRHILAALGPPRGRRSSAGPALADLIIRLKMNNV